MTIFPRSGGRPRTAFSVTSLASARGLPILSAQRHGDQTNQSRFYAFGKEPEETAPNLTVLG